jgi:gliding motility-associated-like protein
LTFLKHKMLKNLKLINSATMKYGFVTALCLWMLLVTTAASAQVQLSFSSVAPSCNGYTNGTATVTAAGGAEPYTFAWSNGQTTSTNFGIGAGSYAVTVTDAANQTATGNVTLTEPAPFEASVSGSGIACDGTSGTLSASAVGGPQPFAYTWTNGANTASIPVTVPGYQYVTVMDGNGCADVAGYFVPAQLFVDVVVTNIPCSTYPDGGAVNATVAGGATPYTFAWSNGSNQQIQQGLAAGTYTVTVTGANGCAAEDAGTITIPTPVEASVVSITPSCGGGNNGSATVTATGGTPPYKHVWNQGQYTGATVTGLAPGQYYVCTFDANNCQHDLILTIPEIPGLNVQLVITKAECAGVNDGTVTAVVTPPGNYNYQWNLPPFTGVSQLTGLAVNTQVSVTVTDPVSGCSGVATGEVGTHNQVQIQVTDTDIPCAGGTGSATAIASNGTAPYNYVWFVPPSQQVGTGATISDLAAGAYGVSVTDDRGCTAVGVADIGIGSGPEAAFGNLTAVNCGAVASTIQFTSQSSDPFGQIVAQEWTLTPTGQAPMTFSGNQFSIELPVNQTGTIRLVVTSDSGCSAELTLPYDVPGLPNISLSTGPTAIDCANGPISITVNGDPSYTYSWSPAVMFTPDPLNVTVNPSATTTYQVTASDQGCQATASVEVQRVEQPLQLSVASNNVVTCEPEAILTATANSPTAVIIWKDANGNVIPGNPITVPAGAATTYTVTATDGTECTDSEEVTVSAEGLNINVDPTQPSNACVETGVQLGVVNNNPSDVLTYQWASSGGLTFSPSSTSSSPIANGAAGTYIVTVTVTNQNNCSEELITEFTLENSISLEAAISTDLCDGTTVTFENTSGVAGTWNFGDGSTSTEANPTHTYATAGVWNASFTPNSTTCVSPWQSSLNVQATPVQASIANNYQACTGQAIIQFSGTAIGAGEIGWNWTFSGGTPATSSTQNPSVTFNQAGPIVATLVVTDANNCTATASAPVTVAILNDTIAAQIPFCENDEIELNPAGIDPGATYTWSADPADPDLEANNPNPTVSPNVATTYSVSIALGGCTLTYAALVTPLEASTLVLPSDTVLCAATPLTVTATGNASTFEWSESPTFSDIFANTATVSITPKPNGIYYVRGNGANECAALDSIRINDASVNIEAEPGDRDICRGEETELVVTNLDPLDQLTYDWTPDLPSVANPTVSPTTNTTYQVKVTNQFGCSDETMAFNVNVIDISVTATTSRDTLCPGQTATLTATVTGNGSNYTYDWSPATTLSGGDTATPVAAPEADTEYTVTVTSNGLCPVEASVPIFFMATQCLEPYIFVPQAFTPNNDDNNDFFIVRGADIKELHFIVWDRWGEKVYETKDPNALGWDGTYNGKELTPDAYAWYLTATCGNGQVYTNKGNVTLLK